MKRNLPLLVILHVVLGAASTFASEGEKTPTSEQLEFFERRIRPILVSHCYKCHSKDVAKVRGGLLLDTRDDLRRGGNAGAIIVAGHPEKSILIEAIRYRGDLRMPPTGKLSDAEIADLEAWVKMGAPDPRAGSTSKTTKGIDLEAGRKFWSLQPLQEVKPPLVQDDAWKENPIDAFILSRLQEKGLRPASVADRLTLLRRVTFDLIGLPPTPPEIEAFLKDDAPDAYAKVVDRLLASPHYGERWGRHWLDVVRYADTAGDNSDYPVPQMYLYRNWVINAFNKDMPYDRFVQEQLAGDLMKARSDEDRAQKLIATGYLANSRRHGSYEDKRYPWYLTIEDTIDNLGKTFLGQSIHCARCHDHKFDPFSAEDYYALYGFFSSTRYPWPGIELERTPRDLVPLPTSGVAYAVIDGQNDPKKRIGQVGNVKVQLKGDPDRLGKEVPRRFPLALGGMTLPPGEKGSGRLHLAEWLTGASNPLFSRVIVNRIWHYHFGQGIVATPNDFGKQGRAPSHPELLDYLARRFSDGGWSIKKMHKLILLSRTYRLASSENEQNSKIDPDNTYHWRYPRRRLDAETIRDTLLAVSGNLDRTPGGPHPFPDEKKWNYSQHNPFKAVYDTNKRSVYLMTQRFQRHPYLALFDGPDTNASTGARTVSTTPLQALFLMNNPFVDKNASKFASRLQSERSDDVGRIDLAYRMCFGRPATEEEKDLSRQYLAAVRAKLGSMPPAQQQARAWESFVRVLFMSNEFVYVN